MAYNDNKKYQTTNTPKEETILLNNQPIRPRSPQTHCHVPDDKLDDNGGRNRIIAVLVLCIIFMIIETVGGIISSSTAVLTDAAHMGIDAGGFIISLSAIYLGRKRPTQKLSFSYIRAEILGALLSVLLLWVGIGILVYMAIQRCIYQNFEVEPNVMMIVAACGVLFNIIMFLVLHLDTNGQSGSHHGHSHGGGGLGHSHGGKSHGHSHDGENGHGHSHEGGSHGHSHSGDYERLDDSSYTDSHDEKSAIDSKQSKSSKNINVQAAVVHVVGDFVQSVGVLVAAIIIKIKPEYKLADPICTFIFSVLVLITTITIMRDIVLVLMQGVPTSVNYTKIAEDLLQIPGVRHIHSLHIWSLSIQKIVLSVHIAIDADRDCLEVLSDAQEVLRREHSITQTTIQVESYDASIMDSCESCVPPTSG